MSPARVSATVLRSVAATGIGAILGRTSDGTWEPCADPPPRVRWGYGPDGLERAAAAAPAGARLRIQGLERRRGIGERGARAAHRQVRRGGDRSHRAGGVLRLHRGPPDDPSDRG